MSARNRVNEGFFEEAKMEELPPNTREKLSFHQVRNIITSSVDVHKFYYTGQF